MAECSKRREHAESIKPCCVYSIVPKVNIQYTYKYNHYIDTLHTSNLIRNGREAVWIAYRFRLLIEFAEARSAIIRHFCSVADRRSQNLDQCSCERITSCLDLQPIHTERFFLDACLLHVSLSRCTSILENDYETRGPSPHPVYAKRLFFSPWYSCWSLISTGSCWNQTNSPLFIFSELIYILYRFIKPRPPVAVSLPYSL